MTQEWAKFGSFYEWSKIMKNDPKYFRMTQEWAKLPQNEPNKVLIQWENKEWAKNDPKLAHSSILGHSWKINRKS